MKKALVASLVALTVSAPAFAADFTGFRASATIGLADDNFLGDDVFTYGVNVGYDRAYGNLIAGVTAEFQESGEDFIGRDLSIAARLGTKVTDNALVYGLVGYTNLGTEGLVGKLDGVRVGAGAEVAFNDRLFGNVEYRYSNYELGVDGHQTLIGLGVRF